MNIQHLKYAIEVEKTGSITQAAENLFMGQPNLSRAIKELEDNFGITIFKRTSKGMIPTKKGKLFLVYAKNILTQIDELETIYRPNNSNRQSFSIAVARGSYISDAFMNYMSTIDSNKEIDISFKETNSIRAIKDVADGDYNLGIIRYQSIHESHVLNLLAERELLHNEIWEFEYLALMSEQHPLAGCVELIHENLLNYIEIIHGDLTIPHLLWAEEKNNELTSKTSKKIYVYERCSQFELLTSNPLTYMWASPVTERTLKLYNLVQRKCAVANNLYKDVLIYPKGYKFKELDKVFLDKLYESKNQVSSKEFL